MTPRRNSSQQLSRRLLVGLPLLALAGCGGDSASPEPTAVSLTAPDILAAASARLTAIQSLRFTLSIDGETYVDTARTIELLSATGSLLRPNAVDTEFKVKVLRGLTFSVRMIVLGAERWTTDLVTGSWGPAPVEFDYDPGLIFDTADGLGPILAAVTGAVRGPDDRAADRDCFRVDAAVEQAIIKKLTANTMQGSPVSVELWVDQQTNDLLRANLREPATPDGKKPTTWTLDLFDQGKPVTIDRPVVDGD